jgi:gas vesicle protein
MSKNNESGFVKGLALGALIGATAGAITALLFAPKTGRELRQDLAIKSGEIYDDVEDIVASAVNTGKTRAQEIISSAKKQAEGLMRNAEKIMADAKVKAIDAKDTVQSAVGVLKDATKAGVEAFKDEIKTASNDY